MTLWGCVLQTVRHLAKLERTGWHLRGWGNSDFPPIICIFAAGNVAEYYLFWESVTGMIFGVK